MRNELEKSVRKRAHHCCEYCLSPEYYCPDPFELEHITPESKSGERTLHNLALACSGCNGYKYDFTEAFDAASGLTVPLYNPRLDKWSGHFRWNEDFTLILGITPTGRATVQRLKINREGVVNLRRVLVAAGEHPPTWL